MLRNRLASLVACLASFVLMSGCMQTPTNAPSASPSPTATPSTSPSTAPTSTSVSQFSTTLTGGQEAPTPVTTAATGSAAATLNAERTQLKVRVVFAGLSGPATSAHLHLGTSGQTGGVVKQLAVSGNEATVTWTTSDVTQPLTTDLVSQLLTGGLYVNVHTSANPNGEIRGQLSLITETPMVADLTGAQAGVTTPASGSAHVNVSSDKTRVVLTAYVYGLPNGDTISSAHIHQGAAGQTGGVVKELTVTGNTLSVTWTTTDQTQPLTADLVTQLLQGNLYINVHTTNQSGGEVRGQIVAP